MTISLNKQLDKEMYVSFHDGVVGGVDFGKKIRSDHPGITFANHVEYIDLFYAEHAQKLQSVLNETKQCLDDVKAPLFSELKSYFGRDFSGEDSTCHLSIFDINARFIETKTFQVFYRRSYGLRKEVIAHELTHFAFYDFCFGLGLQDGKYLWELSEIFNVIFLNLPSICAAIGAEELLFYPNLKEKLTAVTQVWDENLPAKDFIGKSLGILQAWPGENSQTKGIGA